MAKPQCLFAICTELVPTGFCLFELATATKVDVTVKCQMCVMGISIFVTDIVNH